MLSICDRHPVPAFWLFLAFLKSQSGRPGHFPAVAFSSSQKEQLASTYREVASARRILSEQSGDSGRVVSARLSTLGVKLEDLLLGNLMSYFSDVFPDSCLERIWDIILGGSRDILSYTCCALLIALRKRFEEASSAEELVREARNGTLAKGIDMDAVVQTGIGIWERNQPQYSVFRSATAQGKPAG